MLGVRESSLHVADVELGWYKQRCVQLQATIDELADTLEEEIEKREATQQVSSVETILGGPCLVACT